MYCQIFQLFICAGFFVLEVHGKVVLSTRSFYFLVGIINRVLVNQRLWRTFSCHLILSINANFEQRGAKVSFSKFRFLFLEGYSVSILRS